MVSKATKIRLGVFLSIGCFLIILFGAAVAGSRLTKKWDKYYIIFENYPVSGLQVGGTVNYQGIKVGRVEAIKIDPDDVRKVILTINVEAGTPIKEDTEAILSLVGITGLKAVDIRGGTNEAKKLKPGSFIKAGSTMLDDISGRALSIAEKIDLIAANINDITNEENKKNIAAILSDTSILIRDTRMNLSGTLESLNRIAMNTAKVTDEVGNSLQILTNNLAGNLDAITNSTTSNMDRIGTSATNALDNVSLGARANLDSLTRVTKMSLEQITANLDRELIKLTTNLDKSISDINDQTGLLLKDTRLQVNSIGENSNTMILETTKQITAISSNINRTLDQVNVLLYSPEFNQILVNLSAISKQLSEANMKGMVGDFSNTLQRTGVLVNTLNRTVMRSQDNLLETLENLREATENLNDFSRQISDTPSILLRGN